jgi:hypothetical protein
MTRNHFQPEQQIVKDIANKLHQAANGKAQVSLKYGNEPFAYRRLVSYMFDDVEIEFYIETKPNETRPDEDGFFRFVSKACLSDGREYNQCKEIGKRVTNPYDLYRLTGGNSDKLVQVLKDAK